MYDLHIIGTEFGFYGDLYDDLGTSSQSPVVTMCKHLCEIMHQHMLLKIL